MQYNKEILMYDEEKVKKDLENMRETYKKAIKDMDEILARQEEVYQKIYKIYKDENPNN